MAADACDINRANVVLNTIIFKDTKNAVKNQANAVDF
ncbi:hypothetical protein FAM4067_01591 [Lacticaseibacillus paracasei]|nr:hypothetical protein CDA65_00544 [Lacticaseibacillus paracasei]RND37932.1 hypothetical protein FAM18099_01642 [Lacticaseibacillus paracasei]RND40364.1 hypothetical protein FAM10859_01669 [Lacticaseibacillus paracasei]RND46547.1 hypothetical protein FAM18108_01977 [Lacticaseibacillus paracasei]RNE00006.1 hypothetical protein FAM22276_01554 [Lacticaseibacillus paracasei]